MTPLERYRQDLAKPGFVHDPAQEQAIEALQQVYDELLAHPPRRGLLRRKLRWPAVRGLYMWGGVGRGKTYLMDVFFEAIPFRYKRRTHFHRFMLDVQERRQRFTDTEDPLKPLAEEYARDVRLLCFDEFYVSDIADAMILGRLIEVLTEQGVTIVATSNVAPDELYKEGLQRQNFLPAIERIKSTMRVLQVDGGVDHRLRHLTRAPLYHYPLGDAAEAEMAQHFEELSTEPRTADAVLQIHGRDLHARYSAECVAWFDFDELCEGPRSVADYIELARLHHTILISNVPRLDATREDAARRFINLVDEFYDRGVKLILSAAVDRDSLYSGQRLRFEFRRTRSRLLEMQSKEYLALPHRG